MVDSKIAPGARIHVEIVKHPTNARARKTLVRVLGKDEVAKTEQKRLEKVRKSNYRPRMRGGRLYGGQMVKMHPVKGQLGESGTVTATTDVLADLNSVSRFVSIKAAS